MPRATKHPRRATAPKAKARPKTKPAAPRLPMPSVLIDATTAPDLVSVPTRTVLSLDGQSAPEDPVFFRSIMAVYAMAYTLKFSRKKGGRPDFKIGPLEARWWSDEPNRPFMEVPREAWRWQVRMAVPPNVSAAELARTIEDVTHKKGGKLEGSPEVARVRLSVLPAAPYGRVLHVGPYADEGRSFARLLETVCAAGRSARNAHSEVYLSDPRRTKPEKLKTVLLLELA